MGIVPDVGGLLPEVIVDLLYMDFGASSPAKSSQPAAIDASIGSSLVAGDPKDHFLLVLAGIHPPCRDQLDDAAEYWAQIPRDSAGT